MVHQYWKQVYDSSDSPSSTSVVVSGATVVVASGKTVVISIRRTSGTSGRSVVVASATEQ